MKSVLLTLFSALIIIVALGAFSKNAEAAWWEFFFPSLRDTGADVATTLQAPFADDAAVEDEENVESSTSTKIPIKQSYENPDTDDDQPLKLAHRTGKDVSEWLVDVVSETMTFTDADYKAGMKKTEKYFDAGGHSQYIAFLTDQKIMNVVESGQFKTHSFVNDATVLMNEGAVQGRYRWLYEIPVTVTYLKQDIENYKNIVPINQEIVLLIQVGRADEGVNDIGLRVERWSGRVRKIKKAK